MRGPILLFLMANRAHVTWCLHPANPVPHPPGGLGGVPGGLGGLPGGNAAGGNAAGGNAAGGNAGTGITTGGAGQGPVFNPNVPRPSPSPPSPRPPAPNVPPLPPLTPSGVILNLPRLDVTFPLPPSAASVDSATALESSFSRALLALDLCMGCSVEVDSMYASNDNSAATQSLLQSLINTLSTPTRQRLLQASGGDDVSINITGVLARIAWQSINRTVLCPPPPPKAPGAIDLVVDGPAVCTSQISSHSSNDEHAIALQTQLNDGRAAVDTLLHGAGLNANITLSAAPVVYLRYVNTPLVLPPLPPPSPSEPPPPPSPPSPPAPPPGSCSDACGASHTANGVCEDGGVGSATSPCALGTDCSDCGVRIFCTRCAARALNTDRCRIRCSDSAPPLAAIATHTAARRLVPSVT